MALEKFIQTTGKKTIDTLYKAKKPLIKAQSTIDTINEVILTKENDLKLEFRCDNNFRFNGILRWGKGAGFSNLRLDLK